MFKRKYDFEMRKTFFATIRLNEQYDCISENHFFKYFHEIYHITKYYVFLLNRIKENYIFQTKLYE